MYKQPKQKTAVRVIKTSIPCFSISKNHVLFSINKQLGFNRRGLMQLAQQSFTANKNSFSNTDLAVTRLENGIGYQLNNGKGLANQTFLMTNPNTQETGWIMLTSIYKPESRIQNTLAQRFFESLRNIPKD